VSHGTGCALTVEGLQKTFKDHGAHVRAVDGVGFEVRDGEVYTLLGPSGCGKTSTLRAVAGLERPDGGRISIDGVVVTDVASRAAVPPNKRDIGMVFQSYGIWPHMTVFENAAFPLRVGKGKLSRHELRQRVEETLATVHLAGYESRMATQLSGGQQQRLALARALVRRPKLLLLDEPLSNLDAKLRKAMRAELTSLQQDLGITTLYVTHDQDEALSMSSRIAVMAEGRILQEGRPRAIYEKPTTRFVAEFVGVTNFLAGVVRGLGPQTVSVETSAGLFTVDGATSATVGSAVTAAVRAEAVRLHSEEPMGVPNVIRGELEQVLFAGGWLDCIVRVAEQLWSTRQDVRLDAMAGDTVWLELPSYALSLIEA